MHVNCKKNVNIHMSRQAQRKRPVAVWFILWLFYSWAATSTAQTTVKTGHTTARLLSEQSLIAPGHSFWLALQLTPDTGWHTYWKNPGDAGKATAIKWNLPAGLSAGPLHWPYPQRIRSGPLVSFGYADTVSLLTEISGQWPAIDRIEISAAVDWLVCEEICIPESAVLTLSLPIASREEIDPESGPVFKAAREHLPEIAPWAARYTYKGNQLVFDVPLGLDPAAYISALFFPVADNLIEHSAGQSFLMGKDALRVSVGAGYLQQTGTFQGVLVFRRENQDTPEAVEFTAHPVAQLPDLGFTLKTIKPR
jgi:DsbC/DsbD-like thiol-disulfide interchange protein